MSGIPRAVLDTDIIFSRVLHELFGRIASDARLLDLIWSDELLAEARRVLIERKPLSPAAADHWVGYLRDAFPSGQVDLSTIEPTVDPASFTTDPNDTHVCALAIAGGADLLLTFDRGYLPDAFHRHGIEVVSPDSFLCEQIDQEADAILDILDAQLAVWDGGDHEMTELLAAFERAGAPKFAERAHGLLLT
jgi:predicted nucleic acid-binding protein